MKKPVMLIVLVLCASICASIALLRTKLTGVPNPILETWPSQIIFGFYFVILTLSIQGLQQGLGKGRHGSPRQALFLLILIGLCLDLVLIHIHETISRPDASYGLVIIWDVATFFIWLRAVDLCREENKAEFQRSWIVVVAPVLKFGREILLLPYQPPAERAYLDLIFGDLAVCLWAFIASSEVSDHKSERTIKALVYVVFAGCIYWIISAIEHVLFLAWAPLQPGLHEIFESIGVPAWLLNWFYLILAGGTTWVISRWNVFNIGTQFGIARTLDEKVAKQGNRQLSPR